MRNMYQIFHLRTLQPPPLYSTQRVVYTARKNSAVARSTSRSVCCRGLFGFSIYIITLQHGILIKQWQFVQVSGLVALTSY